MIAYFKQWLPVLCLALVGFACVTTELMPIGLLPDIARDMNKSEAFTGLLVTIYAWAVALISVPLTMFSAHIERRKLLLSVLLCFCISQFGAAVSHNFIMLLCSRFLTVLCHAVFWSVVPPLAVKVAPEGQGAKALVILSAIVSLAAILGMPLGAMLGHQVGWRWVFVLIGLVAMLFAFVLYKNLPTIKGNKDLGSFDILKQTFSVPQLRRVYLLTALTVTGHFIAFTYINPFLSYSGGFQQNFISFVMLLLGASGVLGNIIITRHMSLRPRLSLLLPLGIFCLVLFSAKFLSANSYGALLFALLWGMSMGAVALYFQSTVIKMSPKGSDVASSIFSSVFNVGIGSGALVGNQAFNHWGIGAVPYAGAFFVTAAFITALVVLLKKR